MCEWSGHGNIGHRIDIKQEPTLLQNAAALIPKLHSLKAYRGCYSLAQLDAHKQRQEACLQLQCTEGSSLRACYGAQHNYKHEEYSLMDGVDTMPLYYGMYTEEMPD